MARSLACCRGDIIRARIGRKWPICPSVFAHLRVDGTAIIEDLEQVRFDLSRDPSDRSNMPIDYRLLDLLISAAEDPDVGLGNFSR